MTETTSLPTSSSSFLLCPSLVQDLATPPFSLLPLLSPDPDELYSFAESPRLLQGVLATYRIDIYTQLCDASLGAVEETGKRISVLSNSSGHSSSYSMSSNSKCSQATPSYFSSPPSSEIGTSIMTTSSSSTGRASIQTGSSLIQGEVEMNDKSAIATDAPGTESFLHRLCSKMAAAQRHTISPHHRHSLHKSRRHSDEASQMTSICDTGHKRNFSIASQKVALEMMQNDCEPRQVFRDVIVQRDASPLGDLPCPMLPFLGCQGDLRPEASTSQSTTISNLSTPLFVSARESFSTFGLLFKRFKAKSKKRSSHVSVQMQFDMMMQARKAKEEELEKARSTLGLSWGCAARQIWDKDGGDYLLHHRNSQIRNSYENTSRGFVLDRTDSHLKHWSQFYHAYSQGRLDLSETPLIPHGVPIFECCPQATPASTGPLEAPTPDWELLRARTYARMELDKLDKKALEAIAEKVAACVSALKVKRSMLHCLEGDSIMNLTVDGLHQESSRRQQSMCAHTILNRNCGMTIQDLNQDWRFRNLDDQEEKRLCYYSGMPVVAANGLPIAVLSIWDARREFFVEPQFLKRTVREIGQIFEQHHCDRWEDKICKMAQSVEQAECRLYKREVLSQFSTQIHGRHYQHVLGYSTPYDPSELQALADLGLLITLEDVERLIMTLEEVASLLNMESIYMAAVRLTDSGQAKEQIYMIAGHNVASSKLSARYHVELFNSVLSENDIDVCRTFRLSQNNCHTSNIHRKPNQPLKRCEKLEAFLVVPIAKRGKIGIVFGAMTKCNKKIIGVEDLRFIQALQPALSSVMDRYQDMLPIVDEQRSRSESSKYSCKSSLASGDNGSKRGLDKKSKSCSSLQESFSML